MTEHAEAQDQVETVDELAAKASAEIAGNGHSIDEVFESLTGFDEIAVLETFGQSISRLADENETVFVRALVFIELVRAGRSRFDAHKLAMHMRLGDAKAALPDPPDEFIPSEPDSETGKGDSLREVEPTT